MKRYRVLGFDFDSRAASLRVEIQPNWETDIKDLHRNNQIKTISSLISEYGMDGGTVKIQNVMDLGNAPVSIIAFHNMFFRQVRSAFIISSYYPALTGACALGERILNHLLLHLRASFKHTSEYKRVYDKESFDNWELVIETLEKWEVLLPEVVDAYRKLAIVRHEKAIHFNPETDSNDRAYALEAINLLSTIIGQQFGSFGPQPWFIPNVRDTSFIKKDAENMPFIKNIYLQTPNCVLVGPYHKVDIMLGNDGHKFVVTDDHQYKSSEISDEEFVELYERRDTQVTKSE